MSLCACGCGEEVRRGSRYRQFHHLPELHAAMGGVGGILWKGGRIANGSYIKVYAPDHPKTDKDGYVREHTLIAERALGRLLPEGARVHHVNEDGRDNSIGNLVLCPDDAYHMLLHQRQRALDACGNANWRRCSFCGKYDDPTNNMRFTRSNAVHRPCAAKWMRDYKAQRRAATEAVA